ncbi:MAG: histidine phosphatase family protein [Proteobacteria bacterium]|jgi:probable phosphoglycerate mutase|nr:histidine phosphatase family protein [Pseudomonadota bacterium]
MTELIFIRHGETDWNRQQRFQGQIDVPLNATGHLQAQRLAEALAGERFDLLLSSDLQRARQTIAPLERQQARPVLAQADWREQGFGVLEGLSVDEIKARHPELWAQWQRHDADYCLPEGESVRRFHTRVVDAVRELVRQHEGRRVLIVTHGGVLDMLWRTVHGHPLHGPRDCAIPNTGINRLRWRAGSLDLERWADDAHLAGLPEQPATVPPTDT